MDDIHEKYRQLGENPEACFDGLLHSNAINCRDYVETETFFSLQKTRTDFNDEEVCFSYNQVTELLLKMMVHEITRLDKLARLNRSMKISSALIFPDTSE